MTDNNKKDLKQAGRRQFLKTIAAGSAVAGVAAMAATQAAASTGEQETAPASDSQNGYRETDHIRAYYDTLR